MNTKLLLSIALLGLIAILPGCYTQVGTTVEDTHYRPSSSMDNDLSDAYPDSSGYIDNHDSDDWQHSHVGYSYYYPPESNYWPSDYYASAYASPWSFSVGFGWGGYYGGSYPYYGYGYGGYYPYYGYGYGCYPYYGYPYYPAQNIRNFGATRTGAPVRGASAYSRTENTPASVNGASSDIYGRIPTGSVLQGGSSQQLKRSNNTNTDIRTQGTSRIGRSAQAQDSRIAPRRYQDARVSGSRGSMSRTPAQRGPQRVQAPRNFPSAPSQSGGRSFSAPPRYSAPAPSGGGGARSAPAPSRSGGGGGGRRP